MRRLLLLGLMLGTGMVGAVKLYTVTVKASATAPSTHMALIPESSVLKKTYGGFKDGSVTVWKLPAGVYNVTVFQMNSDLQVFEDSESRFNVTKNGVFTVDLQMIPRLDPAAARAWNRVLIEMQGTIESCSKQRVDNLCAQSAASPTTIKGFLGLHPEFVQIDPWQGIGTGMLGNFTFQNRQYTVTVNSNAEGSFIGFSRLNY